MAHPGLVVLSLIVDDLETSLQVLSSQRARIMISRPISASPTHQYLFGRA
jgi:hypothetical protein